MNTKIKKAITLIEDRENRSREAVALAEGELTTTKDKLLALRAELNRAESADQYKELLREIHDTEAVLEFCEKRLQTTKNESLTAEEYKNIVLDVKRSYTEIKADHLKSIAIEVEKLFGLIEDYSSEVSALNYVLTRAGSLRSERSPQLLDEKLSIENNDPFDPSRQVVEVFYRLKGASSIYNRGYK